MMPECALRMHDRRDASAVDGLVTSLTESRTSATGNSPQGNTPQGNTRM
jgi:hypothetical protein